ncbi:MAG: hypothetical protein IKH04_04595 [Kiritimatiellae bacterium]|nr:hypothetical protein [Kiritimatiellia bacterium]
MTDAGTTILVAALGFGWMALALAFFLRKSRLSQSLPRVWRGRSALARFAAVAAVVVATVYGGGKPSGIGGAAPMAIPRPTAGMNVTQAGDTSDGGASTNALRFTAFAIDGDDRFDFSIAWPATNLPEYAAIDLFHKQALSDPAWRWIHRLDVWPEDGEDAFTLYGGDLPYWEEVVSRRFGVDTNEVESPFGIVFTNLYARVPELTYAAPRSAFFMLAGQRDADGDGLSDAIELSLGYDPLDPDEEDGVDEMAWVDIVQTQGQSYADSEAFATLGYAFRGKATLDATQSLESSPPNSIPTASFFKAAGCELISVAYGGATSAKRQIMNQTDIFYFSGHGNHNTGTIQSGFSPQMAAQFWCDDLDCVIIAGRSVLDINDYNNNFPGLAHLLSPGKAWEQTGPNILLGYCYKAPLDSTGAPARIVSQWMVNRSVQGDVAAWMNANDNRNGRNACAIEKGLRFHYFRRSFKHFYTHKTIRKEDWQ